MRSEGFEPSLDRWTDCRARHTSSVQCASYRFDPAGAATSARTGYSIFKEPEMTKAAEVRDLGGFSARKRERNALGFALRRGAIGVISERAERTPRRRHGLVLATAEVILKRDGEPHSRVAIPTLFFGLRQAPFLLRVESAHEELE